jgi:hypothetical protein
LIPFTQSLSKDFSTFMIYSEAEREREQAWRIITKSQWDVI